MIIIIIIINKISRKAVRTIIMFHSKLKQKYIVDSSMISIKVPGLENFCVTPLLGMPTYKMLP